MRRASAPWTAAVIAGLVSGSASALSPSEVFEKVAPSVWAIRGLDEQERPFSYGSAVVIGPGRLVTNCHVLAKAKAIQLRRENVIFEAKLEHAHNARDLCLVSAKNFSAPAVTIGSLEDVKVGQRVYAVGNPQRLALTLSEGLISGLRGEEGKPLLQTTAPISPGSSGGGLFDENGVLIGITTFGIVDSRRTTQNLNFAVPAEWARELTAPGAVAKAAEDSKQTAVALPGLPPVGTTWKYRFFDRQYSRNVRVFTVRVSGIESQDVRESFAVENGGESTSAVDSASMRFAARRLTRDHAVVELAPYFFTDPERSNRRQIPSNYPGDAPWSIKAGETRTENVTVPAGTFRATRVDVRGTAPVHGSASMVASANHIPARFHYTAWYSPDVNRYVMARHQTWNSNGTLIGDEVVELLEHKSN